MEQIIEFEQGKVKMTTFELHVISYMRNYVNVKGDFLSDPATLDTAETTMRNCINDLQTNPKHKTFAYANPLKIVHETGSIWLESEGVQTGKRKRICGFKTIKK